MHLPKPVKIIIAWSFTSFVIFGFFYFPPSRDPFAPLVLIFSFGVLFLIVWMVHFLGRIKVVQHHLQTRSERTRTIEKLIANLALLLVFSIGSYMILTLIVLYKFSEDDGYVGFVAIFFYFLFLLPMVAANFSTWVALNIFTGSLSWFWKLVITFFIPSAIFILLLVLFY